MNQTRSMLQSETEYIDAGPHQPASTKASCTARPDHTLGQKRRSGPLPDNFRSTPTNGHSRGRHVSNLPRADIVA